MRSSITLTIGAALGALLLGAPALGEDALEAEPNVPQVAAEEPASAEAGMPVAEELPSESAAAPPTAPDMAGMPPAAPDAMAAEPTEALPVAPADDPWATEATQAVPADEAPAMATREAAMAPAAEALAPAEPAMTETALEATPAPDPTSAEALAEVSQLGGIGYDSHGRQGRIHVVVPGDTLWDISNAYLGTPWVWPSIWNDNGEIDNPHLIHPGDRIWITDSEMRIVSAEEAAALLAGGPPAEPEAAPAAPAFDEPEEAVAVVPAAPTASARVDRQLVSSLDSVGLVTAEVMEASASVVESELEKVMLSQGDRVYIGLGAGDTRQGDRFTVFRKRDRVFDPDTGRLLGWHVDVLGWVSVIEVGEEASLAKIEVSHGEIERGDRLMPREEPPMEIAVLPSPGDIEGRISFFAQSRTMMGQVDYVYLNRGTLDGIEVGSPLQVYREGADAIEVARRTRVRVPDRVIADLLVVRAEDNSSVAFVTHASTEVELGDRFRGATAEGE